MGRSGGARVEAHDARDGDITDRIVVTGTVDTNSTGDYILNVYRTGRRRHSLNFNTRTVTVTGTRSVDLNATVAMDMIWSPPGPSRCSPTTEAGRQADREDEHNVTLPVLLAA